MFLCEWSVNRSDCGVFKSLLGRQIKCQIWQKLDAYAIWEIIAEFKSCFKGRWGCQQIENFNLTMDILHFLFMDIWLNFGFIVNWAHKEIRAKLVWILSAYDIRLLRPQCGEFCVNHAFMPPLTVFSNLPLVTSICSHDLSLAKEIISKWFLAGN